ncbi:MAG TPA: hypothetical protein VL128_04230 [Candidatus Eisenbacteria bacterium]|nr:hypothetical protein [Candidatus Eisenbacteria bacterium]
MWKQSNLLRSLIGVVLPRLYCSLGLLAALSFPSHLFPKETLSSPGLIREFPAPIDDVRQAVLAVVHDQIIHGTLIFDKTPVLTDAEAVTSTPLFDPWKGPGEVYYKIRKNAIAPRHFLSTGDQGTIGVRFVIIPVDANRTRVKVDAIYVEDSHRVAHESDGSVEKSELAAVKDHLEAQEEAAAEAADARRRELSAQLVRETFQRQREDETERLNNAQTTAKDLQQQVTQLHRQLERQVKSPGADLKAAPFRSAATIRQIPAKASVLVLIVTPHWFGIETPDGQRGWLPIEQLEQLP